MRNSTFICLAIVGGLMGIVDAFAPYIALKRVEPQSVVMDERVPPDKTMDEVDDRVEIVGGLMGMLQAAAPYNAVKRVEPHSIVMDERVQPEKTVDEADDRVELDPAIPVERKTFEPSLIVYNETAPGIEETESDWTEAAVYSNVSIIETRRKRRSDDYDDYDDYGDNDDNSGCGTPKAKHGSIKCKVSNKGMECSQACAWGYSVRGRRNNRYQCRDGEWHPDFEPCSKDNDVDCRLRLAGAGDYKCSSDSMNHGPRCEISCYRKGRRPAVHREVECNKQGRWSPSLPHCVRPDKSH